MKRYDLRINTRGSIELMTGGFHERVFNELSLSNAQTRTYVRVRAKKTGEILILCYVADPYDERQNKRYEEFIGKNYDKY